MTQAQTDASARIDAYIDAAPEAMQGALNRMRQLIKAEVPGAVEVFAYGVAGFKYRGRPLVYYGAAKKHYALYGQIPAAVEPGDLQGLDTDKGTIRFPPATPPPEGLIQKVVHARLKEIDAAEAARKEHRNGKRTS